MRTTGTFTAADLEANAPILLDPRRTRLDMEQAAGVISFDFFKANYDAAVRRNITTVHVLQGTARVCTALEHGFAFLCRVGWALKTPVLGWRCRCLCRRLCAARWIGHAAGKRCEATNHLTSAGHPPKWNATHFDEFQRIIDFLVSEGHPFITPTEYFVWQN
jgi:hypothetical protein